MGVPYLLYYVKDGDPLPYPVGSSKIDIEKICLYRMLNHHYEYGHAGFLSERTTLEGIFKKLPALVEMEWERFNNPAPFKLEKCVATDETLEETMKLVEAEEGFVRWIQMDGKRA